MKYSKPITEIIDQRYSCRSYDPQPIDMDKRQRLGEYAALLCSGPFGNQMRFELVAADEGDSQALKGLGTYGYIKNPTGFIMGAMKEGDRNLEDFGYIMEDIILFATDLGLGTCWLGGTFTKSSFSKRIGAQKDELVPAVISIGEIAEDNRMIAKVRPRKPREVRRLPWEVMFFDKEFSNPLSEEAAGEYATALDMIRIGPSASNKQPWRIIRNGELWYFYLQRTPGYRDGAINKMFTNADIQRLDMGIAMFHFEGVLVEMGIAGEWVIDEPEIQKPDELTEYTVSWKVV